MDREEIREIISKVFLKHYADIFVHACTHTFKSQHHTNAEILESQYIFFQDYMIMMITILGILVINKS